jgi:hypothetical protein
MGSCRRHDRIFIELEFLMEELYLEEMDFVSGGADYGSPSYDGGEVVGDGVTTTWSSVDDPNTGLTTTSSYAESDTGIVVVQSVSQEGNYLGSTVTTYTSSDGSSVTINMTMTDSQGNVQPVATQTVHP